MKGLVLVEGTCGAGKTTLIRELAAGTPGARVFGQRETYAPLVPGEDAGTIDAATNEAHLHAVVDAIAAEARTGRTVFIDTLHLTQLHRPGVLPMVAAARITERLEKLGAEYLVLWQPKTVLWERTIVARRGSGFARYAEKFGADEAARWAYFCEEQERIVAAAERLVPPGRLRVQRG